MTSATAPQAVPATDVTESRAYNLTDLGNARRLVDIYGRGFRYCANLGGWHVWDGKRWAKDDLRRIEARAKEIPADILLEASKARDKTNRNELARFALKTEAETRLRAMISLAESEPGIIAVPDEFDRDPWLFNLNNGTLDLRTGELRRHDPANLITKLAPVDFDPEADCPLFREFLAQVIPQADTAAYVQTAVGVSMIGKVLEHILLFLHGGGENGKTTFLRTMQDLFGDYAKQADSELLLAQKYTPHPERKAALAGARLVVTAEVEDGRRMAESLVKEITGGDPQVGRLMHQNSFQFEPSWTIWLAANHRPTIRGTDHAIWRRIKLVPFEVRIPKEDQDPELRDKMAAEFSGILNWALAGAMQYQKHGLHEPLPVLEAVGAYRTDSDVLGGFLEDETDQGAGKWVESSALYERYQLWCRESGEHPISQRRMAGALRERGIERAHHSETRRAIYQGLDLVPRMADLHRYTAD